jgi:hypothetical protein
MEKTQAKGTERRLTIIIAILLIVLVSGALTAYLIFRPQPIEGDKTIQVEIVIEDEIVRTVEINTDAQFLRQALDEANLIDGNETEFGFWITTVNGRLADDGNQEWWALSVNGDFAMYGVDEMPVADGDIFEFRLTVGW